MNRISKDLKKDADRLLPDEKLKQEIKGRLYPSGEPVRSKRPKRGLAFAMSAVACVLVVAIALAVLFSMPTNDPNFPPITAGDISDTLVLIDINPSFEIIADKDGNVKSVTGVNSDARIVLLGKSYSGGSVNDVCTDIIKTAINLGYVNNKHGQVNISAYNEDAAISSQYLSLLTGSVDAMIAASGGTVVATDGEAVKQKLIDEIIAAYGMTAGLDDKTALELHRLLNQYDVTKEKELDELEELWEEELEKAGFDDDAMEDAVDAWKEQYLKPLGEELEDELEYYIDIYEVKRIYSGMSEREAEKAAEEEEYRLTDLGRQDRTALRAFIDEWWVSAEREFSDVIRDKLQRDGFDEGEIAGKMSEITDLLNKKDAEDRKELIAELIEGYYENAVDPEEENEFWEEFIKELYEDD